MAEYWWIGYILMCIGWGLAGYFHKKSRRLSRKVLVLEGRNQRMSKLLETFGWTVK